MQSKQRKYMQSNTEIKNKMMAKNEVTEVMIGCAEIARLLKKGCKRLIMLISNLLNYK